MHQWIFDSVAVCNQFCDKTTQYSKRTEYGLTAAASVMWIPGLTAAGGYMENYLDLCRILSTYMTFAASTVKLFHASDSIKTLFMVLGFEG